MLVSQMYGLGDAAVFAPPTARGVAAFNAPRYATAGTRGQPSTAPPSARSPDLKPLTMFSIARPATLAPASSVDVSRLRAAVTAVTPMPRMGAFDTSALKKAAVALSKPTGLPFSAVPAPAAASLAVQQAALALATPTGPTAADAAAAMSPSTGGGGGGGGGGLDQGAPQDPGTDEGASVSWWESLSPTMKAAVVGGGLAIAFLGYKVMRKHT